MRPHPRRDLLLACLREHPGCTFRGLVRFTGIPAGCCRHHLTMLEREAMAWGMRVGPARFAFFEGRKPMEEAAGWIARQILLDVLDHGILDHVKKGLVGQAVLQGKFPKVPRSTIQHRLSRLQRLGFLEARRQGRYLRYARSANQATKPVETSPAPWPHAPVPDDPATWWAA